MDHGTTDVKDISLTENPDMLPKKTEDATDEIAVVTIKKKRLHNRHIFLSVLIGAVSAVIPLTANASKNALSLFFAAAPSSYSSLILDAPKNMLSIIALTAELSAVDSAFFTLLILSLLFVHRQCYLFILLYLRTFSLILGAGLVIISSAAVYGKVAVGITFAVALAASVYAAVPISVPSCEDIRLQNVFSKIFCALGAVILCRAVSLIFGAYFF